MTKQIVDVFKDNNRTSAAYIFSLEPKTKILYTGVIRKVPDNSRTSFKRKVRTGAAGTKPRYFGKWTNIGGTKKVGVSDLQAVIDELNEETNIREILRPIDYRKHVYIEYLASKPIPGTLLTLHMAYSKKGTTIFIFSMNHNAFFSIFPAYPAGRVGQDIVDSSKGEIDAVMSVNMDNIFDMQNNELNKDNNNCFVSYFCKEFNEVKHLIKNIYPLFYKKWGNIDIPYITDVFPRDPSEFTRHNYKG